MNLLGVSICIYLICTAEINQDNIKKHIPKTVEILRKTVESGAWQNKLIFF